ncbi:hypothetical protein V5O48_006484, partial [Marasmius crinis-equi]
ASGTLNRRGRARRQRLARILDAKDEELTSLKAELTKLSSNNQQIREIAWSETCRAQTEIERLARSNIELKEAMRAKDYLHATAMAQDREEANIRVTMLQQLLNDHIQERDELFLKLDALESKHDHSTNEHTPPRSENDYQTELGSLKTQLADAKARLENMVAEWVERDLQQNSVLESKDTYIAQLERELSALNEQHRSLPRDLDFGTSSMKPELAGVLEEVSDDLALTRANFRALIQEYESILLYVNETARKAEQALGNQVIGHEEHLEESKRRIGALMRMTEKLLGNMTRLGSERPRVNE